jgi:hypothetical protein
VTGGSTYALLVLIASGVGSPGFDRFSLYWALLVVISVGGYLPVEQIVARLTAAGSPPAGLARWALRWGGATAVLGSGAVVALGLLVEGRLTSVLVLALAGNLLAMTGQALVRGLAAGRRRLDHYCAIVCSDAVVRTVAAGLGVALGVSSVAAYAWWIAVACLVSVGVGAGLLRGAAASWASSPSGSSASREAVSLAPAMLSMQLVLNGPVLVAALVSGAVASAGAVLALSSLVRTSVFLVQGAQAAYVARIAQLVHQASDRARSETVVVAVGAALLALATALGAWALGPALVRLLYGAGFVIDRGSCLAVGVGVGVLAAAIVLNDLRVAWGLHARSGVVWVVSAIAATLVAATPLEPETRVFLPTIVGATLALLLSLPARRIAPW